MLDPKEPVPWHYGIYTSMTPGKTGGYEVEVGFHSPADACPGVFRERYFTYFVSPPSGLLVNLHSQTPSTAADGVIIVLLLRSKIFLLTDHCL